MEVLFHAYHFLVSKFVRQEKLGCSERKRIHLYNKLTNSKYMYGWMSLFGHEGNPRPAQCAHALKQWI